MLGHTWDISAALGCKALEANCMVLDRGSTSRSSSEITLAAD